MNHFNILDILALAIIGCSAALAFAKGFTVELIALGSTVLGIVLSFLYYPQTSGWLKAWGFESSLNDFLGFSLIFVGCVTAGSLLTFVADRVLRTLYLKWIDRILGGVFGLLRGALITTVIFLALAAFEVRRDLLATSLSAEFFLTSAQVLAWLAPESLRDRFESGYDWVYNLWVQETADHYE